MESFSEKVYQIVSKISTGKVLTYGEVAKLSGNAKASRAVGNALHKNPRFGEIPCHRVVNKSGKLSSNFAFGGITGQKKLLEKEGVIITEHFYIKNFL